MLVATASLAQSTPGPMRPELRLVRAEAYSTAGGAFVRWRFDVANKASFPSDMFLLSPGLPPCGVNTNASRTWVDFFDDKETRIYGFCALTSPDQLGSIWFATPADQPPPLGAYVVITDRLTNTTYRSQVVDMRPGALVAHAAGLRAAGDNAGAFRLVERAIFTRKRAGTVDAAWYEEALSLAASLL